MCVSECLLCIIVHNIKLLLTKEKRVWMVQKRCNIQISGYHLQLMQWRNHRTLYQGLSSSKVLLFSNVSKSWSYSFWLCRAWHPLPVLRDKYCVPVHEIERRRTLCSSLFNTTTFNGINMAVIFSIDWFQSYNWQLMIEIPRKSWSSNNC